MGLPPKSLTSTVDIQKRMIPVTELRPVINNKSFIPKLKSVDFSKIQLKV